MPDIVDADFNRQHIRLEIQYILLPALLQIGDTIATDTGVQHDWSVFGVFGAQIIPDQTWVAAANTFSLFAPVAIGNTVADEQ